ncbi:hypothetical protein [Planktotalea sp.]|uniref:hypothetical protein n=1 Tax=Planktotalea sp. TaxID=2029877 RepID=UPI003D6A5DD8
MTNRYLQQNAGAIAIGAGLVAVFLYGVMMTVTLANIQAISGQPAFDMRPFGYGPKDAATLLDALGDQGRAYYLSRQIPLDTLYPSLLALTLSASILWLGRGLHNRRIIHIGVAFSIACAVFVYSENFGIVAMLWNWPVVSPTLVHAVSIATILKSGATTIAMSLVLFLGVKRLGVAKTATSA